VALPQPRQRVVDQLDLVRGVPVPRVVAGGAVHARPRQQDHRLPPVAALSASAAARRVSGEVS
jgi:hypothetical protein